MDKTLKWGLCLEQLFNIYINDLFYNLINTHRCDFVDDTTLNACSKSIEELPHDLKYDTLAANIWFENDFMKVNEDKCHFLILGKLNKHIFAKVRG